MIARYDITQGTEEWYKIRYGKIGGTLSGGLFVKSDTLLITLLAEFTEPFEMDYESYISKDMERGFDLEPLARQRLSEYTGVDFKTCGWLQSSENELLGISPDGIDLTETVTCEIKCPGAKRHIETVLDNCIPDDNIRQCIHYFTVNPKLERHYFCSFRPESIKPMYVKELTLDSMVNLGTNARPVNKTIRQAVEMAKEAAKNIQADITKAMEKINF